MVVEAEAGKPWALPSTAQDPQHDLLAVAQREHRDPKVDRLAAEVDGHSAVLRDTALRDVERAHHLQPARDGRLHVLRHVGEVVQVDQLEPALLGDRLRPAAS
jgi:hypothetical protein